MPTETHHVLDETAARIYPIQLVQIGKLHEVPAPLVRVSTCGGVQLEVLQEVLRTDPPQGHYQVVTLHNRPKGSSTSLTFLKILVSLPEHYASKDWLTEHLPRTRNSTNEEEQEWGQGLIRVDNVVSLLRTLLCPSGIDGEEVLRKMLVGYVRNHRESGPGYRLAADPLVWLDVDVIAASVKQAILQEQEGNAVLSWWEQVYALASRGSYLPDEAYSDWAKDARLRVEGYVRQSVHALRRLYLLRDSEAGEEQAIVLLRTYWLTHPLDEDVLRPLMELLGKHNGAQEALEYYQRLCERVASQGGGTPDERTQKTAQNLRIEQSMHQYVISSPTIEPAKFSSVHDTIEVGMSFSPEMISTIRDAENEEERKHHMNPLRRTVTAGLVGLLSGTIPPLEWYDRLASAKPTAVNIETFSYFRQLLECGWGLSNSGELHIAEQLLSSFLPRMIQLAPYQQQAAFLAAEGMRLRGILVAHQQRMLDKLMICLQAVEHARQAQDPNILIAQLTELAIAFIYAHQQANAFNTYKEALSYCKQDQLSPLVCSRIYAASAVTFAKHGYAKEAYSHIKHAYEIFPTHLEGQPNILSADNGLFMIGYYEGLYHLVTEHPIDADDAFERALVPFLGKTIPERWRIIILNYQGLAAIMSNQQEKYAQCLETGISAALTLGSKKRLDEALCIFQHNMPKAWSLEPRIKQIAERFQLQKEEERKEELEI